MAEKRKDRHRPGYTDEFNRQTYTQINCRVRKDSGIAEGVRIVANAKRMSVNEYVQTAIENQLSFDGYIPGEPYGN